MPNALLFVKKAYQNMLCILKWTDIGHIKASK